MTELATQSCRRCGGCMQPGVALAQTYTGVPDFPGDAHPITLSPSGPGRLVRCMKCSACGWSVAGDSDGKSGCHDPQPPDSARQDRAAPAPGRTPGASDGDRGSPVVTRQSAR